MQHDVIPIGVDLEERKKITLPSAPLLAPHWDQCTPVQEPELVVRWLTVVLPRCSSQLSVFQWPCRHVEFQQEVKKNPLVIAMETVNTLS